MILLDTEMRFVLRLEAKRSPEMSHALRVDERLPVVDFRLLGGCPGLWSTSCTLQRQAKPSKVECVCSSLSKGRVNLLLHLPERFGACFYLDFAILSDRISNA